MPLWVVPVFHATAVPPAWDVILFPLPSAACFQVPIDLNHVQSIFLVLGCGNIQVILTSAFRGLWSKQEFPSPRPLLCSAVCLRSSQRLPRSVSVLSPTVLRALEGQRAEPGTVLARMAFSKCSLMAMPCLPDWAREGLTLFSPTTAILAISDSLKVIFYLICTACDVTVVFLE